MNRITAIDVETSGLNPARGDRVLEIAAVTIADGNILAEFSSLIRVACNIPKHVTTIHGITSKMLTDQPAPETIWPQFLAFIGDTPLVAHNAPFDIRFIRAELNRLGYPLMNPYRCTLDLARQRFPRLRNHKLETVARHVLGTIPSDCQLHRALGDARLVARMWGRMGGELNVR